MPKDPRKNIQNYKIDGGHLNEYEFQRAQGKLAEESEFPFISTDQKLDAADFPNQSRRSRSGGKSKPSAAKRSSRQVEAKATDKPAKKSTKKTVKKTASKRQTAKGAKKAAKKSSATQSSAKKTTQAAKKR